MSQALLVAPHIVSAPLANTRHRNVTAVAQERSCWRRRSRAASNYRWTRRLGRLPV